jgi:hypothetical protein
MKPIHLAIAALLSCVLWALPAHDQGYQCRTSPVGASTAYCASEAFVTESALPAATKAQQQAGASNAVAVTPLHQQDHDSAVKAHASISVLCSGTPCTLGESYNVTSITRSAAGQYTVNFTTPFASASGYACKISSTLFGAALGTKAAGSIGVDTAAISGGVFAFSDSQFDIACEGRQ